MMDKRCILPGDRFIIVLEDNLGGKSKVWAIVEESVFIEEERVMAGKFIQKAVKRMEEKGTKGAFTAQAKKSGGVKKDGGIKESFIEKELNSKNPTTRKRAQFAKNMKKIAGGK